MNLESIVKDGERRIIDAVERVLYEWGHKPYCNGINDDTSFIQACLDDEGGLTLTGNSIVTKPLKMPSGSCISGAEPLSSISVEGCKWNFKEDK